MGVSTNYGNCVDNFELNLDRLSRHLIKGGFSDELAASLNIFFLDRPAIGNSDKESGLCEFGRYDNKTNTIFVYDQGQLYQAARADSDEEREKITLAINGTLIHELEHAMASRDEFQKELNQQYRFDNKLPWQVGIMATAIASGSALEELANVPFATAALGLVGLGTASLATSSIIKKYNHNYYYNSPEERRCRAAVINGPRDLLSINYRAEVINAAVTV